MNKRTITYASAGFGGAIGIIFYGWVASSSSGQTIILPIFNLSLEQWAGAAGVIISFVVASIVALLCVVALSLIDAAMP